MKRWGAIFAGVAVLVLAWYLFMPETGGLIWHMRHGSHARVEDMEFQVPSWYWSDVYPEKSVLGISTVPGRAQNFFKGSRTLKVSLIVIYRAPDQSPLKPGGKEDPWAAHVYRETLAVPSRLAGAPGNCIQYEEHAKSGIWNGDKDIQMHCQFAGGWLVSFSGTEPGLQDFYQILKTAVKKTS